MPTNPPWIRVAVVRDQPQVDVAVQGQFRIIALQNANVLREGSHLPRVEVRASREGILFGEQRVASSGLRVEPAGEATVSLNGHRLRGTLEIVRQNDLSPTGGYHLLVVNHVALEDYLQGVLSKEAPYHWPAEALKAIAIAARTYALFQRLSKTSVEYDVTSDVLSQVYGGKAGEKWRTNRIVKETAGLILTYRGRVFPAFYHSTCGGVTEDAVVMGPFDLAPLKGGRLCEFCRESPFYRWQRRVTAADLAWAIKQQRGSSIWPVTDLAIVRHTSTGRIAQIRIRGTTPLVLSGYEFRQLLGFSTIRSTALTIAREGDGFALRGQGWGHGVGLCQWGTAHLARRGLRAHEILSFYYPQAELVRLGEVPLQA
ncbi:MAG: SpoIID/LytB domain-containing protein, partial [Candidatus Omnitrophica bacterium]|nr:SpoIID/LytB domain-containing protein [Candidatus Omnitrophota bacterium]